MINLDLTIKKKCIALNICFFFLNLILTMDVNYVYRFGSKCLTMAKRERGRERIIFCVHIML